jgi:penicillin-insensitive murein DD-endopeptidase
VRALLLGLALCVGACTNTPSPLAPGFRGTVGVPHEGVQTEAVELSVRGPGFERFRPHSSHYWGRPRLVAGLARLAQTIRQRFPDSAPLVVGDLSARGGGKIPGHNSHRTGRDVDLLFFYTTPAGASVKAPGFIHVEADGLAQVPGSGEFLRLDVVRQWELVKLMVSDAELGVQFVFVSRHVEALLVDYALARGEPLETVWRAQAVMLEPGDSAPHDDHAHVRIACSPEETVAGCSGGGPLWEWLPLPPSAESLHESELSQIVADDPLESGS